MFGLIIAIDLLQIHAHIKLLLDTFYQNNNNVGTGKHGWQRASSHHCNQKLGSVGQGL